jgi:guanine deaminase
MTAGAMTKDEIMLYAVALSRREIRGGKVSPFAAMIVRDGVIVGEGCSHVVRDNDSTAHGGSMRSAMRAASSSSTAGRKPSI